MAFRGYLALNGVEIANSSRVIGHLGQDVPVSDVGLLTGLVSGPTFVEDPPGSGLYLPLDLVEDPPSSGLYDPGDMQDDPDGSGLYPMGGDCAPVEVSPGLFEIPSSSSLIQSPYLTGRFYTPPDGSRRYGRGLVLVGDACWEAAMNCGGCLTRIPYDDSWPGLRAHLVDPIYRPELAPWYTTRAPESAEFTGIWVLKIDGLDTTPVQRQITQLVGAGAVAGKHRDASRTLRFEALLLACTNVGLEYGLDWLTCRLRETTDTSNARLQYYAAHPGNSTVDPDSLRREARGVVLTQSPEIAEAFNPSGRPNQQATMYRVTWEMAVLSPYVYMPSIDLDVEWDSVTVEPIEWVHAADCAEPAFCEDMPVLWSAECTPQTIEVVSTPPPSCGGCMPVCEVDTYRYTPPLFDYPVRCRETAVNMTITNVGPRPLTLQGAWQVCNGDERCDNDQFPIQISGLPPTASVTLDSVTGRFWAEVDGKRRRPVGIVGTKTGAPWRPVIIDRETCWQFVVTAPGDVDFEVTMSLADREP